MYRKKEFGWGNKKIPSRLDNNAFMKLVLLMMLFVAIVLLGVLLTNSVYAITGTGGTISLNSEIGAVSYDASGVNLDAYGGSATVYGLFNDLTFDGRLGLLNSSNDAISNVTLTLVAPANGIIIVGTTADFNYIPSGQITSCSLYIDGSLRGFTSNPNLDVINSFTIGGISVGKHTWNISCNSDDYNITKSRNFTVIFYSGFNSSSTNLTNVDASAVPNLTLSKSFGQILFSGYTNLSSGVDLTSNVIISSRSVYINSSAASMLNRSAIVTLNNISFNNILIWRDGLVCTDCNILSLSNNQLVFNVTGFSNYTITSTSRLETYDTTDYFIIMPNQSITFDANYTNVSSGSPITGLCNITLPSLGMFVMNYNLSSQTYQYSSSSLGSGISSYTINCIPTDSGFDSLEVNSTCVVSTLLPDTFANINATIGPSSNMILNTSAAIIDVIAGNLTELSFDSQTVTNTWQGYYGNIVGKIQLTNANSSVLYNWDMVSPNGEVYAVRSPTVNWNNIRCANISELELEDIALGVSINASDSVVNTFENTSSFNSFFTGATQINASQNCYTVHLNDNNGTQSTKYSEVLLSDSSLLIYTAILDPGSIGFDGSARDFEIIVGEDGHNGDAIQTMYYFYIELG